MTLRVEIQIVPFGEESNKYEIYRLDISNVGRVRNEGFGHEICRYKVSLFGCVFPARRKDPDVPEYELIDVDWIEEHDRRDGAVALVAQAAELMKERA